MAASVEEFATDDGAFQARGYADLAPEEGGYEPINPPLIVALPGTWAIDINRWQPLIVANAVSQNNLPVDSMQRFLGSQWLNVRPFALAREKAGEPWFDPGPPPFLGGVSDAEFRAQVVELIQLSGELDPDDGVTLDLSPGAMGNHSLGANDGHGRRVNPATGLPYAPNLARRGDFGRVMAEFWTDGPSSETPPGHWNVLANDVADSPGFVRGWAGAGPELDELEWDVKVYFALNAAMHDAACGAWSVKRYYDGWRPISAIRFMGQLGQSSDPDGPAYHRNGLPLIPGLIELTSAKSVGRGERHEGLPEGKIVLRVWPGQPEDPATQHGGARWIPASEWIPYQKRTFVTPSFPGYISGHSAFSRAGAEALAAATGSPFFPGGLAVYRIGALAFEAGPSEPVELQWATYFDASDQAGRSRLWGGIHAAADDLSGRRVGAACGRAAFDLASRYFDGSIARHTPALAIQPLPGGGVELRCQTVRGWYYRIQTALSADSPWSDDPAGFARAGDTLVIHRDPAEGLARFYRVAASPIP